ncbi:MAG: MEDS domain-containing protein [Gammaproteobacteria bacterium]|nr:MEDS domain-containing protein [Gammaproteobacteria bacterium]
MEMNALESSDPLLNIKQAAALLNVSEVSLRRWTDSGRLKCSRVGRRRERRFRREDLQAFVEDRDTPAALNGRVSDQPLPSAHITLEGISIEYGSHLCTFYESELGRLKLSVPFLADGLHSGDICYLVATAPTRDAILENLQEVYPDLERAVGSGQLVVSDGMGSAQEMLDYFEYSFVMALRDGGQALRVLGDMAWFLDQGLDLGELMAFETRFNCSLAHRFPVVSLCQYDVRLFSGSGVLNALKCHEDTFQYPLSRFLGI